MVANVVGADLLTLIRFICVQNLLDAFPPFLYLVCGWAGGKEQLLIVVLFLVRFFFKKTLTLLLMGRKRLFSLINELPTVFEVVTERKPVKDKPSTDSGSKSRGSTKVRTR